MKNQKLYLIAVLLTLIALSAMPLAVQVAQKVFTTLDFQSAARIINLSAPNTDSQPVRRIDFFSRTITAGTGLSGGGDLSADRTINLANTAVTAGSYTLGSFTVDAQGRLTAASNGNALTSLNGLTGAAQLFAIGTIGTDFGISSSGNTHTFNLPTASATNRGLLSAANWSTFNNKQEVLSAGTGVTIASNTVSIEQAVGASDSPAFVKVCYTGTSVCDYAGSGSPESNLTASVGSTYRRTDGGTATSFYIKETGSGNTAAQHSIVDITPTSQ